MWTESNGEYQTTFDGGRYAIVYQRGKDGLWHWEVDEADGDLVASGRVASLEDAQATAVAASTAL